MHFAGKWSPTETVLVATAIAQLEARMAACGVTKRPWTLASHTEYADSRLYLAMREGTAGAIQGRSARQLARQLSALDAPEHGPSMALSSVLGALP